MYHEKLGPNKRIKEKVKQYVNHVHSRLNLFIWKLTWHLGIRVRYLGYV